MFTALAQCLFHLLKAQKWKIFRIMFCCKDHICLRSEFKSKSKWKHSKLDYRQFRRIADFPVKTHSETNLPATTWVQTWFSERSYAFSQTKEQSQNACPSVWTKSCIFLYVSILYHSTPVPQYPYTTTSNITAPLYHNIPYTTTCLHHGIITSQYPSTKASLCHNTPIA